MLKDSRAFGSFSVDNLDEAKQFYADTLGLNVSEDKEMGLLMLHLSNDMEVVIYPKGEDHAPATFTILNFTVKDIDKTVEKLKNRGVQFERYDNEAYNMDKKNISRSTGEEPDIAWFKDPAGNILSVLQTR